MTSDPYVDRVRRIVLDALAGQAADAYLFGSRARGDAVELSDVDVAIDPHEPLPAHLLLDLREALEESTIPHHVDIVDMSTAGAELRRRINEEGVKWTGDENG